MEEERVRIPVHLALRLAILILALAACTTPRVVVLNDPLSAQEHVDLGVAYERKGMLDLAKKEYLKAADMQDSWAVPCFNLGNIAYKEHDLNGAENCYRKALSRDPQNPDIMNNLAGVLHEMGRTDEARSLISKALSIQRKDEYLDTERMINQARGQSPMGGEGRD
jgi:Flp pilus assembly protein TadD